MKCNKCNMLQVSNGGVSLPTHEIGCPNANKVWNEEDQEWQDRQELDIEDEDWMEDVEDEWGDEDDDDFDDDEDEEEDY